MQQGGEHPGVTPVGRHPPARLVPVDHGSQCHPCDECLELAFGQFGQRVQEQVGLRSRKFQVAEEPQQLTSLIDRQVQRSNQGTQSDGDLQAVLRTGQDVGKRGDVVRPLFPVQPITHKHGPAVFQAPNETVPTKTTAFRRHAFRIDGLRALDLRPFFSVGPSAGRLLLATAQTLFLLFAEAVIAGKPRRFRRVGFFALSENRFQFDDPRPEPLDLFRLPTDSLQQIVNPSIAFAKFLLHVIHTQRCSVFPHIQPRSVRRMGIYLRCGQASPNESQLPRW